MIPCDLFIFVYCKTVYIIFCIIKLYYIIIILIFSNQPWLMLVDVHIGESNLIRTL